jgi:hypothetical protein
LVGNLEGTLAGFGIPVRNGHAGHYGHVPAGAAG